MIEVAKVRGQGRGSLNHKERFDVPNNGEVIMSLSKYKLKTISLKTVFST